MVKEKDTSNDAGKESDLKGKIIKFLRPLDAAVAKGITDPHDNVDLEPHGNDTFIISGCERTIAALLGDFRSHNIRFSILVQHSRS